MRILTIAAAFLAAMAAGTASAQSAGSNNMSFSGRLVAEPCTLDPADAMRELNFRGVTTSEIYAKGRSAGRPITLHLQNCDIGEGRTRVNVTLTGHPSSLLPGHLNLNAGGAVGVAIGLETSHGIALPLNQANPIGTLTAGGNDIVINAFLRGEPAALANRTIHQGAINATVTFAFSYD
ncbi:type 1 fimbria pilin [Achromobacter deleyi]|uniref:fimbrial protein n=1 Tax=Achromobacter TaxID=222 RepID=UPI000CFB8FB1|nr:MULTISPECIES: fimbrial protein [Achromobacter]MDR6600494.1 type 1 fimbria pilin [Achromobacter deleyi]PQZ69840.1 exotoxin [Achromobacter sp. MYb9]